MLRHARKATYLDHIPHTYQALENLSYFVEVERSNHADHGGYDNEFLEIELVKKRHASNRCDL